MTKCKTQQCFSDFSEHQNHLRASSHPHCWAPPPKFQIQQVQGGRAQEFAFLSSSQGEGATAGLGSHLENTNAVYTDVCNKAKEIKDREYGVEEVVIYHRMALEASLM